MAAALAALPGNQFGITFLYFSTYKAPKGTKPSTLSAQTLPEPNIAPFHLGKNT